MKTKPVVKKTAPQGVETQGEKFEFLYFRYPELSNAGFYILTAMYLFIGTVYFYIDENSFFRILIMDFGIYFLIISVLIIFVYKLYTFIFYKEKEKHGYGILHENYLELYIHKVTRIIKYQEIKGINIYPSTLRTYFLISTKDGLSIKIGVLKDSKRSYEALKIFGKAIMKRVKEQKQIKANRK